MSPDALRALQAPLKTKYKDDPVSAKHTIRISGAVDPSGIRCAVGSPRGEIVAGLHPAAGGDGSEACSGDMLLEALVGCAGVTLRAVATAMGIPLRSGTIVAEGDLDFRGTLGVSKDVPIGFSNIRLKFQLDTDAPPEQIQKLVQLTERYCVIYQTLKNPPTLTADIKPPGSRE